jgi:hypothetical protein
MPGVCKAAFQSNARDGGFSFEAASSSLARCSRTISAIHGRIADIVMSLYEVSDIVRDTSFRARDLVRRGEPVLISERSATRSLKQWDRIATRVVQVGSRTQISGAVLPFEFDSSEELLRLLRKLAKRAEKEKQKFANLVGSGVDNPAIVSGFSDAAVLRAVTPTITTLWLIDAIDSALSPLIPEVRNAEGDELLFCTVHYPLAAGTTSSDIRSALGRCPELRQEKCDVLELDQFREAVIGLGQAEPTA